MSEKELRKVREKYQAKQDREYDMEKHSMCELSGKCKRCGETENGQVIRLGDFCPSCAEQIERETRDDVYATARDGWYD